jgi:sugar/nucleoside kinase (ribokinase family)
MLDGYVIVDPAKGRPWSDDSCAKLIKANAVEAFAETGIENPLMACLEANRRLGIEVVVTDGPRGMYWAGDGVSGFVPAKPVRCVDPCGAGDTVAAAMAAASGDTLESRCQWASELASRQVQSIGVVRV